MCDALQSLAMAVVLILTSMAPLALAEENRTRNHDLPSQFDGDSNRVVPSTSLYTVGGDVRLFYDPSPSQPKDYYHSGYWLNVFGELRPLDRTALNLKLVAYDPSNSYGYAAKSLLKPFFSASYYEEYFGGSVKLSVLAFDLDQQTLGAGLLVQEKEMSGAISAITGGDFSVRWIKPGTSVFDYGGDADLWLAEWKEGLFGAYEFDVTMRKRSTMADWKPYPGDPNGETYRFRGLYSKWAHPSGLYYGAEYTQRARANGHMERVGFRKKWTMADVDGFGEYRDYRSGLMTGIAGNLQQDYVSFDDREKRYVTPMNLFAQYSSLSTMIAGWDVRLFPKNLFRLASRGEAGVLSAPSVNRRRLYAYEHQGLYCPYAGKDSCVSFAYSSFMATTRQTLDIPGTFNQPAVDLIPHYRLGAKILF